MKARIYYTGQDGLDRSSVYPPYNRVEDDCGELIRTGYTNVRFIQSEEPGVWDSILLDAARLIYGSGLPPYMAIAYVLHRRGLNSSDTAKLMSKILGKDIPTGHARDYMRRGAEKLGETLES